MGYGLGFIDTFKELIDPFYISIREINELRTFNLNNAIIPLIEDLKSGKLRFLQTFELANTYYQKQFLGYTSIMQYHKETDKLLDEIANITQIVQGGNIRLDRINKEIGKVRVSCLLAFYLYPENAIIDEEDKEEAINKYEISKRMALYYVISGTFYKYMFKCIENENIQVLFYYNNKNKLLQFKNICDEKEFKELFRDSIESLISSKEDLEVRLYNGSRIKFVLGSSSSRGFRYHYAIVDKEISKESFNNVIDPKGVLFEMAKREGKLTDNYNIEFIDM
jgi:hypothetical protein